MKARRQLGYGLAIVTLVGLIWWLARGAGDGPTVDRAPEFASAARAPGTRTVGAAPGADLPTRIEVEPLVAASTEQADTSCTATALDERLRPTNVTGRIVDAQDDPVAGAHVVLLPEGRTLELMNHSPASAHTDGLSLADLPATTSGVDGRFALQGYRAVDASDYLWFLSGERGLQVLVLAAGRALCAHRCEHYTGGDYDAGDIRVEIEGGTISARFIDEQGHGVQGVRVLLDWDVTAELQEHPDLDASLPELLYSTSGANGDVEVPGVWPGKGDLLFKTDSYASDQVSDVVVSAGNVAQLGDVVLHRAGVVRGRVLDAEGRPVANAEVWPVDMPWASSTLRQGRINALSEADVAVGWIEARKALRGLPDPLAPELTDSDGRFERSGLVGAEYVVLVDAAGFDPAVVPKVAPGQDIEIRLQHEASLRVTAVAAGGSEPVRLDAVRAFRLATVPPVNARLPYTRSAVPAQIVDGTTAVVSRAGRIATTVELSAKGFATQAFDLPGVEAPGVLEQRVELAREATLSGLVLDEDGHPVADVDLKLVRKGVQEKDQIPPHAVTDADGRFAFGGLASGEWKLTASKTGFLEEKIDRIAVAAAVANPDVELVLHREGAISGRVWEADGRPAAGLEVRTWIVTSGGLGGFPAATDAEGHFEVRGLEAATYHFLVPPGPELEVPLEAGQHLEIELHRRPPPIVRGRVLAGDVPQP